MMLRRHVLPMAVVPVSTVALCAAAARAAGGDPLLGAEAGLAVVIGLWLTLLMTRAVPAVAGQRELERLATLIRLREHEVRLLHAPCAPAAFVVGPLRPAIFVSRTLLDVLDAAELDAVLLHEEHHRRTLAPLRGLALVSWSRLVGGLPAVGRWIERRLAHLEIEADRHALAAGASPAAMASALIKCERSATPLGIGFASTADLRLRLLLEAGPAADGPAAVPIEWLAPALLALGLAACHLFLG